MFSRRITYKSAHIGLLNFLILLDPYFLSLVPSNPIYHQLSSLRIFFVTCGDDYHQERGCVHWFDDGHLLAIPSQA